MPLGMTFFKLILILLSCPLAMCNTVNIVSLLLTGRLVWPEVLMLDFPIAMSDITV